MSEALVRLSMLITWLFGAPERWGLPPGAPLSLTVETETVSSLGSRGDYLVKMDFFFFEQ